MARPIVDHSVFDALDDDEDDTEFRTELAGDFFDERESTYKALKKSLKKEDWEGMRQAAHKQKGGAATLGFMRLAEAFKRIEIAAREAEDGDEEEDEHYKKLIRKMDSEYDKLFDHLKEEGILQEDEDDSDEDDDDDE